MALIVQKYGGTSVGTVERIQAVTQRILKTAQAGNAVVVVVSAMGDTTDTLVSLAKQITASPPRRELDLLLATGEQVSIALVSIALQTQGQPAIALTGAQVGIITEANHTCARILRIETQRLRYHLEEGKVIIIAGFQGISSRKDLEVTTLGRGGSDTTAVALAAALEASWCEIYTDVPGIFTTDPRLVQQAQLLEKINCEEMLELASLGAKVLHPRAVEIARNYAVPLVVRSSWTEDQGTLVVSPLPRRPPQQDLEIFCPVERVELARDQVKVALLHIANPPEVVAYLFEELAAAGISVDLIIQSIHIGNVNDITFTVSQGDSALAIQVAKTVAIALGGVEVVVDPQVAKVSIVGAGMIGCPGVAAKMFTALGEAGINLQLISTSEIKVSCIIGAEDGVQAVVALCQSFGVDSSVEAPLSSAKDLEPPVRGVALDEDQAHLAVLRVLDRPGCAARLFQTLAQEQISVDMIIQSQLTTEVEGVSTRDIALTIAREELFAACRALEPLTKSLACGPVVIHTGIAKVSVVGIGMARQPSVAVRMFRALANVGINIESIATSETRISCLVAKAEGVKALQAVHQAFGLGREN